MSVCVHLCVLVLQWAKTMCDPRSFPLIFKSRFLRDSNLPPVTVRSVRSEESWAGICIFLVCTWPKISG